VRATGVAAAHEEAAAALRACAAAGEQAQASWRLAESLERQDAAERAARVSAALAGVFVVPYEVDGSPLRRQARRLAADSHAQADAAHGQAAAALRALAAAGTDDARLTDDAPLSAAQQATGLGRGAVDAVWGAATTLAGFSLPRLVADPEGWGEAWQDVGEGIVYAAEHPGEAGRALVGWDLLSSGRYGEWAGGFLPDLVGGALSGGALPAGRRATDLSRQLRELSDDVDDLERLDGRSAPKHVDAGGPVQPRPGASLPGRYPRFIADLAPERRRHILVGDPPPRTGGGHRFGAGRGKSEFPESWSDDDIVERVMQTAMQPQTARQQPDRPTLVAHAEHAGICVRAVVDRGGRIVTAHPLKGRQAAAGCPTTRSAT
jgi:hypothetical protein